jgi:hypothetical protein
MEGRRVTPFPSFQQQASGQIFEDDVNGFFLDLEIYIMV